MKNTSNDTFTLEEMYQWPTTSTATGGGVYIKDYMLGKHEKAKLNRRIEELEDEIRRLQRYVPHDVDYNPFA